VADSLPLQNSDKTAIANDADMFRFFDSELHNKTSKFSITSQSPELVLCQSPSGRFRLKRRVWRTSTITCKSQQCWRRLDWSLCMDCLVQRTRLRHRMLSLLSCSASNWNCTSNGTTQKPACRFVHTGCWRSLWNVLKKF